MEDENSLLSLKTRFPYSLKSLLQYRNIILPFTGFLVFLTCLLFIFSVLLSTATGAGERNFISNYISSFIIDNFRKVL